MIGSADSLVITKYFMGTSVALLMAKELNGGVNKTLQQCITTTTYWEWGTTDDSWYCLTLTSIIQFTSRLKNNTTLSYFIKTDLLVINYQVKKKKERNCTLFTCEP
jgi:hypothetical protein